MEQCINLLPFKTGIFFCDYWMDGFSLGHGQMELDEMSGAG